MTASIVLGVLLDLFSITQPLRRNDMLHEHLVTVF